MLSIRCSGPSGSLLAQSHRYGRFQAVMTRPCTNTRPVRAVSNPCGRPPDAQSLQSFEVAVPSYKRADLLGRMTLPLLAKGGIDSSVIHIFVASDDEAMQYQRAIPRWMYGELVVCPPTHQGLARTRNFIGQYFPAGTRVISIDDDIEAMYRMRRTARGNKAEDMAGVLGWHWQRCFDVLQHHKSYLFGLSPTTNPFYMEDHARLGHYICNGSCFGFIARQDTRLELIESLDNQGNRDDLELSLLHLDLDGHTLRFSNLACVTRFSRNPGGLQASGDRKQATHLTCQRLAAKYPHLVSKTRTYKDGTGGVLLRRKKPQIIPEPFSIENILEPLLVPKGVEERGMNLS